MGEYNPGAVPPKLRVRLNELLRLVGVKESTKELDRILQESGVLTAVGAIGTVVVDFHRAGEEPR